MKHHMHNLTADQKKVLYALARKFEKDSVSPAQMAKLKKAIRRSGGKTRKPSAYNNFTKSMHTKWNRSSKTKDISFKKKAKLVSEAWGKLSPAQKKRYARRR